MNRRYDRKKTGCALILLILMLLFGGCMGNSKDEDITQESQTKPLITIGFSQIGSESDWRMASTRSVLEAFVAKEGYSLIYNDGQQKQENQIKAIREFIDQDVDYILLDPCVETGWDSALSEAKEAGIPVIVYDRCVKVADDSLYTAWIGSDFYLEGQRACRWLSEYLKSIGYTGEVNIVDIQGTLGSSAQMGRTDALMDAVRLNPRWHLLGQETGDFTTAKGKEVMEKMLIKHGGNIDIVYCENDNEAYGALEAIKNAGYGIGNDFRTREMMVMSFDATREGLKLTEEGSIAVNTECSPLYGPKLKNMIDALEAGQKLPAKTYIEEEQFSHFDAVNKVRIEGKSYEVTPVTDAIIEEREY